MSTVTELKGQLSAIGQDAETTAGGLDSFKPKLTQAIGQVDAAIGGSATRTDMDMIAALEAAKIQVDAAIAALQAAASAAHNYAAAL